MKKILVIAATLATLLFAASCASAPPPKEPEIVTNTPPYDILQHAGTTLGVTQLPPWVTVALQGAKAVEKLPEYKNDYVVVVDVTGKDLEATKMAASLLNAQTEISRYLSLRVKETFSGAQVGDKDKIETYMERVVKSVSEVQFSGFEKAADWWVQYRWYKDANKKKVDREEFRVFQLYTINRDLLQQQLERVLADAAKTEAQMTPDKQKAMDLVTQSMKSDF